MSKDLEAEVRFALYKKGKTQKWLAEKLGISGAYLSDIISGKRNGEKAQEHVESIKILLRIK